MARKQKTAEERKAEAQRKLEKAEAARQRAKAELAAIDAKEKKQQRKDEEHAKFIYGGALKAMEREGENDKDVKEIKERLDQYITAKSHREFLGLPPRPTSLKAGNENLKDQFPEASNG